MLLDMAAIRCASGPWPAAATPPGSSEKQQPPELWRDAYKQAGHGARRLKSGPRARLSWDI